MEDDVVVRSDGLEGFTFAAVFDGHGGFSAIDFLRDELFKECLLSLQGDLLLSKKDISAIREALHKAFVSADSKLLTWLEAMPEEDKSGSTATVMFLGNYSLIISHVGVSCVVYVLSQLSLGPFNWSWMDFKLILL
ncbi:hypothetical protein CDL15_Pgr021822 [Punica granatum]|uniref:protein-serine/threonine phosphatase n=1 Tax=Punica granatum TaxID=22663 RepID=A0A218WS28_PUNGR|nr:hypothetical protein CDL15_Pgr021822 [Punica granatum]